MSKNAGEIHDLLSIGEIEDALSSAHGKKAEIDRLPLFLRLLATAQPLSAVPNLLPPGISSKPSPGGPEKATTDPFIDAVVSRLEKVAATHSAAESIDVLTGHVAPSITRKISKLHPLKKRKYGNWNTQELAAVALEPLGGSIKKMRLSLTGGDNPSGGDSEDNLDASGDEMEDESTRFASPPTREESGPLSRMRSLDGRDSILIGLKEDSQEAHLTRILSEVARLVARSLQPPPPPSSKEDEDAPPVASLAVKADSILGDSDSTTSTLGGLGACLVAILHHAPVLRHRHVAQAFCRASIPQAVRLIHYMGANSPIAVPCLVRGCLDAAGTLDEAVGKTAKTAIRRLAKLSKREAARVRGMLAQAKQMVDLELELALEDDLVVAATILIREGTSVKALPEKLIALSLEKIDSRMKELGESSRGENMLLSRARTLLSFVDDVEHHPDFECLPLPDVQEPTIYRAETPRTKQIVKKLTDAISKSRKGLGSMCDVEHLFVVACNELPPSVVDVAATEALMAKPDSPLPFLTESMLHRDPLVLLQCPLSVWNSRGLRRVALSLLGRLLLANETLTRRESPSEDVAEELITSRNVILLRCLLSLATGFMTSKNREQRVPCNCHVLFGMIRSLVANQAGLVAMLAKSGLPDDIVDWLVDFCPESINDADAFLALLSDRSSLTAAERLQVADVALRVSIAFGDELETKNLIGASLNQVLSAFSLILGPVGVPVNALIEDESGLDRTQTCRKATFRILSALQNVRFSQTGLRNECTIALSKLGAMCKAESTGVTGVYASRRKALLKEIWEAANKFVN